ncbi:hypothetical protein ACIPY6_28455 [Streptomyces sp. NPDC090054]
MYEQLALFPESEVAPAVKPLRFLVVPLNVEPDQPTQVETLPFDEDAA